LIRRGTNTDWLGIRGCLLENAQIKPQPDGAAGLIIGAGGASRAALYTLNNHLHCSPIYILNRDLEEVEALLQDSKNISPIPTIIHVKSPEQARSFKAPHFIVGTVPDFEPQTDAEKTVAVSLEAFLSQSVKGVLLDMCFKPRRTRAIKSAEKNGWLTVEGTHIIGYQIEEQWRLWAGEQLVKMLDRDGAWKELLKAAEESPSINS
jgi:quinate dehydrogenase